MKSTHQILNAVPVNTEFELKTQAEIETFAAFLRSTVKDTREEDKRIANEILKSFNCKKL